VESLVPVDAAGHSEPDPNWPAQAWRTIRQDVSGFLSLVWHSTIAPRRFYSEWADGDRRVLNPLAAALNAVSVLGVVAVACRAVLSVAAPTAPWWRDLVRPTAVACYLCIWGALCHAILRLLGARRPLRTTLGAILYCYCGPLFLAKLVLVPLVTLAARDQAHTSQWLKHHAFTGAVALVGLPLVGLATMVLGALALVAAQKQRGWRAGVAISLIIVAKLTLATIAGFFPKMTDWIQ